MAYIPKKPFAEVILPIMVKKGSVMIGISTYGDPTNFFTKLIAYRSPDGTPMYRQIEYTTICKDCQAKGVKEVCKHRRGELPHWHDADEYAQIFEMLKDDPDIAMKELGGVSVDSSIKPYFDADMIREIRSGYSEEYKINFITDLRSAHQNTVYIAIDPNGGGTHSEYAILSAVMFSDSMVVVGLESTQCDNDAKRGTHLVRHIRALKKQKSFSRSQFIVIVESNYGGPIWAFTHAAEVQNAGLSNVYFARRNKSGSQCLEPGVYTGKESKPRMMERLRALIESKGLRFSKEFTSVCVPSRTAQESLEMLLSQIEGYRERYKKDVTDPLKPVIVELSGKIGPAGQDDLVDCAAIVFYWYKIVST